jgi:CheY-like chemotaxis protein
MMPEVQTTVIAVLDDLFFQVKIADAAKRAGMELAVVKTEEALMQRLEHKPALLIVDLNCRSIDTVQLVAALKAGPHRELPVVGYVSHVQTDLIELARNAGCDTVIARSAFSSNLPQILLRYSPPTPQV